MTVQGAYTATYLPTGEILSCHSRSHGLLILLEVILPDGSIIEIKYNAIEVRYHPVMVEDPAFGGELCE